ncbi:hypothetical protein [Streptosporangium sp. NPDC006930]|uniref:hypothetical protein n=1 Tax=unclassified Streptosporangium TaxID=2632669 RepID=UPI00341349F0
MSGEELQAPGFSRGVMTLSGRDNPFDEIASMLLDRCADRSDWWMIAQVRTTPDILGRLTDEERGRLLGQWAAVMRHSADVLRACWNPGTDRTTMIVRRGHDSTETRVELRGTTSTNDRSCRERTGFQKRRIRPGQAFPSHIRRIEAAFLAARRRRLPEISGHTATRRRRLSGHASAQDRRWTPDRRSPLQHRTRIRMIFRTIPPKSPYGSL